MLRRGSVFRSKRLSVAVSSKLTRIIAKVEPRRVSDSSQHLIVSTAEPRPSKDSAGSVGLQEDFDSRALAEDPTESYLIHENKYPHLRALRTDADIGDGLWICCYCRHENILRHYKGRFPFKYLCCDRCDRTLCPDCHTSEILSPIPYGMIFAARPRGAREVRYCHVCPHCGLSHRAEMAGATLDFYGVTCAGCKTSSYGDWPRYHIGNIEPYRRNPDSSFVKLMNEIAEDASRLAFRWVVANLQSRTPSPLSCRSLECETLDDEQETVEEGCDLEDDREVLLQVA